MAPLPHSGNFHLLNSTNRRRAACTPTRSTPPVPDFCAPNRGRLPASWPSPPLLPTLDRRLPLLFALSRRRHVDILRHPRLVRSIGSIAVQQQPMPDQQIPSLARDRFDLQPLQISSALPESAHRHSSSDPGSRGEPVLALLQADTSRAATRLLWDTQYPLKSTLVPAASLAIPAASRSFAR